MINRHIRDLRMLAGINGVRHDDRRILNDAANVIDGLLADLQLIVALEGSKSFIGRKALNAIEAAFK